MKRDYVYILKCPDGSYYTEVTSNLDQQLRKHEFSENPGCYTYSQWPLELVYSNYFHDVNNAIAFKKR